MQRRFFIFILFTSAYFLSYFYRSANAVIASDLSSELGLSAAQLGLATSVFFATFALTQIPMGIGLDRWGARWVTSGLMLVGMIGSFVFAAAPSFAILTIGRGLIGIGMAGVLMGSLKMFSQWYPPERFATMSGLLVGIGSMGGLFAATPMAWLNELVGWRTVFVAIGGLTFVVALVIMLFARNTPPGVAWPEPTKGEGGIRLVLQDGRFWRIALFSFFVSGAFQSFLGLWAGPYLFDVHQLTEIEAGNVLLLIGIGATLGFISSGWVADQIDLPKVVFVSAAVFVLAQVVLAFQPPLGVVRVMFFLFGFAGSFSILVLAHVRRLFPDSITGQAVSALNLFGFAGTFLLQWLMGIIVGSFGADSQGSYPPAAYMTMLLLTAGLIFVVLMRYRTLVVWRE